MATVVVAALEGVELDKYGRVPDVNSGDVNDAPVPCHPCGKTIKPLQAHVIGTYGKVTWECGPCQTTREVKEQEEKVERRRKQGREGQMVVKLTAFADQKLGYTGKGEWGAGQWNQYLTVTLNDGHTYKISVEEIETPTEQ